MSRKYKPFDDYTIGENSYWYATKIHIEWMGMGEGIDFGISGCVDAQFHILMEGV